MRNFIKLQSYILFVFLFILSCSSGPSFEDYNKLSSKLDSCMKIIKDMENMNDVKNINSFDQILKMSRDLNKSNSISKVTLPYKTINYDSLVKLDIQNVKFITRSPSAIIAKSLDTINKYEIKDGFKLVEVEFPSNAISEALKVPLKKTREIVSKDGLAGGYGCASYGYLIINNKYKIKEVCGFNYLLPNFTLIFNYSDYIDIMEFEIQLNNDIINEVRIHEIVAPYKQREKYFKLFNLLY